MSRTIRSLAIALSLSALAGGPAVAMDGAAKRAASKPGVAHASPARSAIPYSQLFYEDHRGHQRPVRIERRPNPFRRGFERAYRRFDARSGARGRHSDLHRSAAGEFR